MNRGLVWIGIATAFAPVACKKHDKADGATKTAPSTAPAPAIDLAAVNALVPASLKDKLVFEQRDLVEERGKGKTTYTLAAPKGWAQTNKMFTKVKPVDDLGFMTSFDVGSNCDGDCVAKDWKATSDKVNFEQFRSRKIEKDEAGKTDHMMISSDGDTRFVMYAWWTEGSKHYFTCMASLEKPVADAAPAFEKACRAVSVVDN